MDISSKKLPALLIIALIGILLLQFMTNDNSKPLIDPETCESILLIHKLIQKHTLMNLILNV